MERKTEIVKEKGVECRKISGGEDLVNRLP